MEHTVLSDENWALAPGVLDLWHVALPSFGVGAVALRNGLNDQERQRADRFIHAGERRLFLVGRWVLRQLLGRYLQRDPAKVEIAYGPSGKPAVAGSLEFNLSHSRDRLLFGFAHDRAVGVDIQWIDPALPWTDFAGDVFAPGEAPPADAAPEDVRCAFFACWVGKEAVMKVDGSGLAQPFSQIRLGTDNRSASGEAFIGTDYTAAWAVEGPDPVSLRVRSIEGGCATALRHSHM